MCQGYVPGLLVLGTHMTKMEQLCWISVQFSERESNLCSKKVKYNTAE